MRSSRQIKAKYKQAARTLLVAVCRLDSWDHDVVKVKKTRKHVPQEWKISQKHKLMYQDSFCTSKTLFCGKGSCSSSSWMWILNSSLPYVFLWRYKNVFPICGLSLGLFRILGLYNYDQQVTKE